MWNGFKPFPTVKNNFLKRRKKMSVVFHNFKSPKGKFSNNKVYYKQSFQNTVKKAEESYLQKNKAKNILKIKFN
jgi:hypothetical protein